MRIVIQLSFDHDRDADILSYIDSISSIKRNALMRGLLRDYIRNEKAGANNFQEDIDTIKTLLQKLVDTKRQIHILDEADAPADIEKETSEIDDDIYINLDNIGV
jgi:hypothetical protein